jgi:hypothetical protein
MTRIGGMMVRPLAILGICCALAGRAGAQAAPDYDAARRHYMAAKEAQGKGDWEGAVRSYILAYDITKDPSLFKQIGATYEAAGKKQEALVYYRRYLSEASGAADVAEVRARVEALDPPPAPAPAPPAPEEELGEPAKLPPESPPAPELEPVPPVPTPPALFDEPGGGWQRTAAWITVGLAAAAVTTGAVLATSAQGREDDIQRLLDTRDPTTGQPLTYAGATRDDYEQKVDEGRNLNNLSTIAFVSAGALTTAAIVFFILDATRPAEVRAAPVVTSSGAGFVVGWSL